MNIRHNGLICAVIIKRFFSLRYLESVRGNVSLIFACVLGVTLLMIGGGVDYARTIRVKSNLQDRIDAAVLAGKSSRANPANQILVAERSFKIGTAPLDENIVVKFHHEGDLLVGEANTQVKTEFYKFMKIESMQVAVKAAASSATARKPLCFMAMHPTRHHTLELKGSVSVIAPDCHIYGNSNHPFDVVDLHGQQNYLTGRSVQAIGYGHHVLENVTPPLEYATELIPDPLASLVIPSSGACKATGLRITGSAMTINPGTFCNGLNISNGADVSLNPGTYIIDGGDFIISNATIRGEGVTLVLKSRPRIKWDRATIKISAPKTGPYTSMAVIGDRVFSSNVIKGSTVDIHGVVYLPNAEFEWFNTGTPIIGSLWTAWIVDGVSWRGSGVLNINFQPEKSDIPYPAALIKVIPREEGIRLVY